MEIPDSDDEEEEQVPPNVSQHNHQQQQQQQKEQPLSTARFIDLVLTQLNNSIDITTTEQHQRQHAPRQTFNQNPFSTLSKSELYRVKPLMLTLHCLFPNELLLALDILDRDLVRRLVSEKHDHDGDGEDEDEDQKMAHSFHYSSPIEKSKEPAEAIFLVVSASASGGTTREEEKGYEVRLQAWNCTCPSFTVSAFRDLESGPDLDPENHRHHLDNVDIDVPVEPSTTEEYRFGGILTRGSTRLSPPVCKHLLACVLLVRCPRLFGTVTGPDSRLIVSAKELAAWCAGWGG